jgi:hypothetical protein
LTDSIIENLQKALDTWSSKLAEIWNLVTQTPETFKGGAIWEIIKNIYGGLQAIALALLVLFFAISIIKTCTSFNDIKKPEHALKLFIRFALAKVVVTYGMDLMLAVFKISQGMVSKIMSIANISGSTNAVLPNTIVEAIEDVGFISSIPLWAITLIGSLVVTVLSIIMIMTVYGRFFKLYLYTAIAPIPLSTFAGETTQQVGKSFLKSYAAVCLEGAIIVLSCIIFSAFASSPPIIDVTASANSQVWTYLGELIFNILVLVGTIKMSDRVVREMMGL